MAAENQGQASSAMRADLANGASRRRGASCVSDLRLDQLYLGELGGVQADSTRLHVSQCSACEAAYERLALARRQFEADGNVPQVAARLLADHKATRSVGRLRPWVRILAWPATVSAAAALALVYMAPSLTALPEESSQGVRAKGTGLSLSTYVKFAGQDQPGTLHMGQPLGAGDRLQFRVSTTRPGHLAILSLDSRGDVSVFYPPGAQTVPVPAGRDQPLGTAVELDDSPGEETVVAMLCNRPLPVASLAQAVKTGTGRRPGEAQPPTPLVENCAEVRTTLTKKPARHP